MSHEEIALPNTKLIKQNANNNHIPNLFFNGGDTAYLNLELLVSIKQIIES